MAIITQQSFDALQVAFAKWGYALEQSHKAQLQQLLHKVADADANAIVDAIAAHVDLHGVASVAQNPIRSALTGAEPGIDNVINSNIDGGFAAIESLLLSFTKGGAS